MTFVSAGGVPARGRACRWLAVLAMGMLLWVQAPVGAAAQGRLQRVQEAGALRVCMWPEYYSISYRNDRTGELQGIDIELARALAADLGVRVAFVETNFARFIDDLLADRCDIGMFGIGATPARAGRVAFSRPYLRSDIYAVVTRTNPRVTSWADIDQDGMVVAVQAGTLMETFAREHLRRARIVAVTRQQEREDEVQSGRADAFLTDYPYGMRMVAFAPWARLVVPDPPVLVTPYAYAVAPGDAGWLARVDAFVAAIKKDGRLEAAAARNSLGPIVARD